MTDGTETNKPEAEAPGQPAAAKGAPDGQPAAKAPANENGEKKLGPRKRHIIAAVFIILGVLGAIGGVIYWLHARQFEETDDAMVDGGVTSMSPQVAGIVSQVAVVDNQHVTAGQLLVQIDRRNFQAKVEEAQANLTAAKAKLAVAETAVGLTGANTQATLQEAQASVAQAQAGVAQMQAGVTAAQSQVASAQADVVAAQAEATRRNADLARYDALDPRAVSQQARDAARAAAEAADAQLAAVTKKKAAAEAAVVQAQSAVAGAQSKVDSMKAMVRAAETGPQQVASAKSQQDSAKAAVAQAQAAFDAANLNLSYTRIVAPIDGIVTRKSVEPGQYVQEGQALMALVPEDLYVTANFKETQLDLMHPGQPAEIYIDRYPGRVFKGHVDSIQAGTGARFSMFPPENATGNYVKVVQRVPVKILFNQPTDQLPAIGPGMSVVPVVRVRGPGSEATTAPATATATDEGD